MVKIQGFYRFFLKIQKNIWMEKLKIVKSWNKENELLLLVGLTDLINKSSHTWPNDNTP